MLQQPENLQLVQCGLALRPSSLLAMAQAVVGDGPREAAPEALTEVCVRPRQSLWRLPVPHSPQYVRGVHTYTDVREGRRKQTSSGCGCLTSARECRFSMCVLRIEMCCIGAVSYTHLTLPTILRV